MNAKDFMTKMPDLDVLDAMTITVIATEAFLSVLTVDDPPSKEIARGVVLLYDQLLQRVKPLLPRTPEMQHVFDGIAQAERLASAIRELDGLPRKI